MILSEEQIQGNIAWLMNKGSPAVKYMTHANLAGTPPQSEVMKSLRQGLESSEDVKEIFSKQKENGSWYDGGSWALAPSYMPKEGWDPYNPKYVTAVWILPLLGEMGYTAHDRRIRRLCAACHRCLA